MLFSDGACSRRVSLFKTVLFSAKMRKAQEREKELGVGRERENFVVVVLFCFVLCGMPREGGKRQKMKKKNEFEKSTLKHENLRVRYVMLSF